MCDVCGVVYLRSSLRRGSDGLLRCPEDAKGRSELELAEATARQAAAVAARVAAQTPADGARPDLDSNDQPAVPYAGPTSRRTVEDVYPDGVPTYADPGTLNNYEGF